jgi:alpha/beta superfamily hydrolase
MLPNPIRMKRFLPSTLMWLISLAAFATPFAHAQDYEREQRWADEIVPDLVVGEAVSIEAASGRAFLALHTKTTTKQPAMVIVHGVGVHPDHGVIGVMRSRLADRGYTTLSIQMPVLGKDKGLDDYYPALFPDAADRIGKAAAWLAQQGHRDIILVSHSMGSWMSNVHLDGVEKVGYAGWVCMGLTGGFRSRRFGINWPMLSVSIPILDVYGENDLAPAVAAAERRARAIASNPQSKQLRIDGADHFYAKRENQLVDAIDAWVRSLPRRP